MRTGGEMKDAVIILKRKYHKTIFRRIQYMVIKIIEWVKRCG